MLYRHPEFLPPFLAVCMLAAITTAARSQSASSPTFFVPGHETAPGGACASYGYQLDAGFGSGIVAELSMSTGYRLVGGFTAMNQVSLVGHPVLSGVQPGFGPLLGGTTHTLHGHELATGSVTRVAVDGKTALVLDRARDQITMKLPAQSSPGWKTVSVTHGGGTAHLARSIAVLPLLDRPRAIRIGEPFRLSYQGNPGDMLYLAVALARLPEAAPIPPFHHGIELDVSALAAFVGPLQVTDPSGLFHLDLPGFQFVRPVYVQMLAIPTLAPGYAPGCFTNLVAL